MEKEARGRRGKGRGKRAEATGASSRSEATWVSDDARTYHARALFVGFLEQLECADGFRFRSRPRNRCVVGRVVTRVLQADKNKHTNGISGQVPA